MAIADGASQAGPAGRQQRPFATLYDENGLADVIVDTSAIMAILRQEPDAPALRRGAGQAEPRPACRPRRWWSSAMVTEGRAGAAGGAELDDLLAERGDRDRRRSPPTRARSRGEGWRRFGKGQPPGAAQPRRLLRLRAGAGNGTSRCCSRARTSRAPTCGGRCRPMPELLLELFSEEIPARMQARAAEDLSRAALRPDRAAAGGRAARLPRAAPARR